MKIWITRTSASTLMGGGLERVWVHFVKPTYLLEVMSPEDREQPYGSYISESHGYYREVGWKAERLWLYSQSFGKLFGYADEDSENKELALYVWGKVCEQFNNLPFEEWERYEKEGHTHPKDFLLEIDIKVSFEPPNEKA